MLSLRGVSWFFRGKVEKIAEARIEKRLKACEQLIALAPVRVLRFSFFFFETKTACLQARVSRREDLLA